MRDEALFTAGELVRLLRADVRALLVICDRHRDRLTPLEASTLNAIVGQHGDAPEPNATPAADGRREHQTGATLHGEALDDEAAWLASLPPDERAQVLRARRAILGR